MRQGGCSDCLSAVRDALKQERDGRGGAGSQMREREEGSTPPGPCASSDQSLALLMPAGTRLEGRKGFITMSHYCAEKRSGGGSAPAQAGPS